MVFTYSIPEAEKALGFSHAKMYEEINAKRIKTYRVGRRRFISAQAINNYISDREAES